MNNEKEFEYLNNTQKEKKRDFKGLLFVIYWILQIFLYVIYIIVCIFCTIIELFFVADFGVTACKSAYKRKRKKKKIFF